MSDLAAIFSTQKYPNDDGTYDSDIIESYDKETDAPPNLSDAIEPIPIPVLPPLPEPTRMIAREQIVDPLVILSPVMILPADANRVSIYLRVYSPTAVATDGVRIAGTNGETPSGPKVLAGNDWPVNDHTGAIWVYPCVANGTGVASAPVAVEYWAVTR